jgi:hypothetical protein
MTNDDTNNLATQNQQLQEEIKNMNAQLQSSIPVSAESLLFSDSTLLTTVAQRKLVAEFT